LTGGAKGKKKTGLKTSFCQKQVKEEAGDKGVNNAVVNWRREGGDVSTENSGGGREGGGELKENGGGGDRAVAGNAFYIRGVKSP